MKFFVHKLGCPKNDVDAEYIAARLIEAGHEAVVSPEEADSVIVNTCGFILPAREESIDELLRMGQLKKKGRLKTLYASGCLSQSSGNELLKGMPELDGAFGLGEVDSIADAVTTSGHFRQTVRTESRQLAYLDWKHRFITDGLPYAYLKISDGCNRPCAYCAIPSIRGAFRSRSLESIVNEAEFLAGNGKKELILVSQESTLWGIDLPGKPGLIKLLEKLEEIDGVEWIRLMYLYPTMVNDSLIDYLASDNKTLNYFDLPLQHCNGEVLQAMRRQLDRTGIERLVNRIRARAKNATLRTTFIVGFPGETEEQFEELEDFVIKTEFERLGVFTYSKEEGTAAGEMSNQVPEPVKEERKDRLMQIQQEIAVARNNLLIGTIVDVIIDAVSSDDTAQGRTMADCPEVDQEVLVHGDHVEVGQLCRVRIDAVDMYDLIGSKLVD